MGGSSGCGIRLRSKVTSCETRRKTGSVALNLVASLARAYLVLANSYY